MKLLIVDDHPIVISGCRSLFSKDRNVKVFEAPSIAGARAAMKKLTPDIVIIDDKLADGSGLDFRSRDQISKFIGADCHFFDD